MIEDDEIEMSYEVQALAMRIEKRDRRRRTSLLRRLFGWLMREKRSGSDRRGKVDLG